VHGPARDVPDAGHHRRLVRGALHVGSPDTVARKIATTLRTLDATRFDLKYGMGGLSHELLMTNIDLYGNEVIPLVRDLMA
jgi:hypothetical protein